MKQKKYKRQITGHTSNVYYVFYIEKGTQALTASKNEIILWDTRTWTQIFELDEYCIPAQTAGMQLSALIYESQVKFWNQKLVAELSDKSEDEINVQE